MTGRPNGRLEVPAIGFLDLVREDLRVGLADEAVAAGGERLLPFGEVFEDAVVDDDDPSLAIPLGMSVGLRRPAVRRPPSVANPECAGRGGSRQPIDQA